MASIRRYGSSSSSSNSRLVNGEDFSDLAPQKLNGVGAEVAYVQSDHTQLLVLMALMLLQMTNQLTKI